MSENEINKYPVMEKQMHAVGAPFSVLKKEPKDVWMTNYSYYLKQRKNNGLMKPLYGRMNDKQFQVYIDGEWVDKDLWKDYSEPVFDRDGNQELNSIGKPKNKLLFDNKYEVLIKFENPVPVEYWDKEEKARVTVNHETVWVRMSKNLYEKIMKEVNHPKTDENDRYVIIYDKSKSPADQYSVTTQV